MLTSVNTSHGPVGRAGALAALMLFVSLWARAVPLPEVDADLEARLGIQIFPGAELIAIDGPALETVDLERQGWSFVEAEVLTADFLVVAPIAELRSYYRPLTARDPKLLLVGTGTSEDFVVSVRYAGRHPLHPRHRWLRIVAYRQIEVQPEGR